jgi:hypothetical protein
MEKNAKVTMVVITILYVVCVRVLNLLYVRRKLPYVFSRLNNNTGYRLFMTTNNAFGSGSRVP